MLKTKNMLSMCFMSLLFLPFVAAGLFLVLAERLIWCMGYAYGVYHCLRHGKGGDQE